MNSFRTLLILFVFNCLSCQARADAPAQSATENAADQRTVAKLIPDQRALRGSPHVTLDLKQFFVGTEIRDSADLTFEILKNNSVGRAELSGERGRTLTLHWEKSGRKEIVLRAIDPVTKNYVDTRFYVEVWEPDYFQLFLTVVGGLGLFLLGMKYLSEGMQAIAGQRLRSMIGAVTDNRLMATGTGALVTTLVQSSSITTVITVGFVSAGLLTLAQAIGLIMGANIGTTITGWILVLKIGKYGLPILGASAFFYLFTHNDRRRYWALACMGLGMVFFGLELMKNGFSIVKELPAFEKWFLRLHADTYLGVLKCALVGCVLTLIVQSSSATLGITIGLAQIGVIPFETAAALVLGENVGTTITAFFASLGASTNARRAAYFHILFNLIGVIWITAIFGWYLNVIRLVIMGDAGATVGAEQSTSAIAATHTGFNVTNTLLFLPMTGVFTKLLERLVRDKRDGERAQRSRLDSRMLESPIIGIEQCRLELVHVSQVCTSMLADLRKIITSRTKDDELIQSVFEREKELDEIEQEIAVFMTNVLEANLPHDVVDEARRLLRIADEYESVSDYVCRVAKAQRRLLRAGLKFAEKDRSGLLGLHDQVAEYLDVVAKAEVQQEPAAIEPTFDKADAITERAKDLLDRFVARSKHVDPRIDAAFNRQLQSYRRIRDHVKNVAQSLTGEK